MATAVTSLFSKLFTKKAALATAGGAGGLYLAPNFLGSDSLLGGILNPLSALIYGEEADDPIDWYSVSSSVLSCLCILCVIATVVGGVMMRRNA